MGIASSFYDPFNLLRSCAISEIVSADFGLKKDIYLISEINFLCILMPRDLHEDIELSFHLFSVLNYSLESISPFPIFQFPQNALCLPPKFCISYCCGMLLGICRPPKSISQQYFMQNLGGKQSALWTIGK